MNNANKNGGNGGGRRSLDRMERIAVMAAFTLFLSTIEYMVPKPVPFIRLGIANLPILTAVFFFDIRSILLLVLLKVLGQGLINGTIFSYIFLFSCCGTYAAALTMVGAQRIFGEKITVVGISIFGALASNVIQLVLARFLIFGEGIWLIAPPLLGIGLATSVALGLFVHYFLEKSRQIHPLLCPETKGGGDEG